MPIYEFKCGSCGKEFEEIVFDSELHVKCPSCGSEKTDRLMSCCSHKSAGAGGSVSQASSSGGCAGCSGGNCSTCH
ncbi:FmdB family zinc ribbon protein [Desulfocurvus sp. DL9XJH121]